MSSLLNALSAALGPVVRTLAQDLGCQVAIYRPTLVDAADGSSTRVYTEPDVDWSMTPAFFEPGRGSDPTQATLKPFGVRTTAFGTLTFTRDASGALPVISPFDGFKILTGPFGGYTWMAEADHVPEATLGVSADVRVIAAPAGVIP